MQSKHVDGHVHALLAPILLIPRLVTLQWHCAVQWHSIRFVRRVNGHDKLSMTPTRVDCSGLHQRQSTSHVHAGCSIGLSPSASGSQQATDLRLYDKLICKL